MDPRGILEVGNWLLLCNAWNVGVFNIHAVLQRTADKSTDRCEAQRGTKSRQRRAVIGGFMTERQPLLGIDSSYAETPGIPVFSAQGLPYHDEGGDGDSGTTVPLTIAEPIDDYGQNYRYNAWRPTDQYHREPNVIYRRSEDEVWNNSRRYSNCGLNPHSLSHTLHPPKYALQFFWWYCLCLFFWLLVLIVVIAITSSVYDDDGKILSSFVPLYPCTMLILPCTSL